MKITACCIAVALCAIGIASPASGQAKHPLAPVELTTPTDGSCVPLSGTIYGSLTDTWHGVADLRLGRSVLHVDMVAVNQAFFNDGNIWRGSEMWTLDVDKDNTVQAKTDFVAEHMTDAVSSSGVYHVIELGAFTGGTGIFKHAYGSFISSGPFGPSVKLPDDIQPPPGARLFWIGPIQGTICGLNERK